MGRTGVEQDSFGLTGLCLSCSGGAPGQSKGGSPPFGRGGGGFPDDGPGKGEGGLGIPPFGATGGTPPLLLA